MLPGAGNIQSSQGRDIAPDPRAAQSAVTIGYLGEVLLVKVLGIIEGAGSDNFRCNLSILMLRATMRTASRI